MSVNPTKILIIDDELDLLEVISYPLIQNGYDVRTASDGDKGIAIAKDFLPDMIILDVMMPGKTGMDVCEILRANPNLKRTYISFLTALTDDYNHIKGLELGADDYIEKPISPKVLLTKINAIFRRKNQSDNTTEENNILENDNLIINPNSYEVKVDGERVVLAKKEFELLHLLASNPGKVFLRNEILNKIWGNDVIVGDRTIDVHIRKIRQKLDMDCIRTIKGVGYKFEL